jgi:hypothetical protein
MPVALQNPFLLLTLLVAGWGAWRLVAWLASGGRLPLRGRRGSASAFAGAGLAVQALYNPSARHAIEARAEEDVLCEEDDDGDPPDPVPVTSSPRDTRVAPQ